MNKFKLNLALAIIGAMFAASPAIAASAKDALSSCIADNTTGKDRKELARWVFVAMSAHPEIQPFSNVTDANRIEFDKKMAALATRLMTESCKTEAKAAVEKDGSKSMEAAFSDLGRLAMKELTANPAVDASFARFVNYLDKAKFESTFGSK